MVNLQKIKTIAKSKKITMRELAKRLEMSEQGLHQLIRNNSTTTDTLSKIADVLGVDIRVFFGNGKVPKQRVSSNKVFLAFEIDKEDEDRVVKMIMGKEFIKLIQSE